MAFRKVTVAAAALVILASLAGSAAAQIDGVMITPYMAYQWGGTAKGWDGEAKLNDAGSWGFVIDVPVHHREAFVELSYSRQVTELMYREYGTGIPAEEIFDLSVEYYQIGGLYTVPKDGPKPFGTITIGATRFAPQNSIYGSEWMFSAALGLGVIVPVGEKLGIRVHTRLLLPFLYTGGGLWCGSGGCSVGISGGSSIPQGDVAVGIVLRL